MSIDVLRNIVVLFSTTKSFGTVCILYIPFADQCSFLSLRSTIEAKHRIKSMTENDLSRFSSMNVHKENLLVAKQKKCEIFWKVWDGSNMSRLLFIVRVSHFSCFHLVPTFHGPQEKILLALYTNTHTHTHTYIYIYIYIYINIYMYMYIYSISISIYLSIYI